MFLNLITASILASSLAAQAGEGATLPADQAFRMEALSMDGHIHVRFTMASNEYYLYRDKLTVQDADGDNVEFAYASPGESHIDEYFGESYVYRDEAHLMVFTDEPFTVTYQGCKEGVLCYPPTTSEVDL